jgi:hypothetical protein
MEAQEAFDAVMTGVPDDDTKVQGILRHGGILRSVMGELKTVGFSPIEILSLITFIVDLIQEYGPVVADIVKKIREKFGK